jgi:hypothetical protein
MIGSSEFAYMQIRNIVIFSKPYEIFSIKYLWPSSINTQNIFFKFYHLTELLGFLDLSEGEFFICFCMKTKLYQNKLGIFLFSLPREIFQGHLLIYGYIKVWPDPVFQYIMKQTQ